MNEATAGRGAFEIASCVHIYIESMGRQNGLETFIFCSDNFCLKKVISLCNNAMVMFTKINISSITHKYLE